MWVATLSWTVHALMLLSEVIQRSTVQFSAVETTALSQ